MKFLPSADASNVVLSTAKETGKIVSVGVTLLGEAAEGVIPYMEVVNLAVGEIKEFFDKFQSNQEQASDLLQAIKLCGTTVTQDMLPKVKPTDRESFRKVAFRCMKLILRISDRCEKWQKKYSMKQDGDDSNTLLRDRASSSKW